MSVPVTVLTWLAACIPIFVLLLCLLLKVSSLKAAFFSLLSCIVIALLVFRSGFMLLPISLLKGIWSALPIVAVIFTAIVLYAVCQKAGVMQAIGNIVKRVTEDELLQVLLISSVSASFLQGITGYGVPIAVCAPLLIAIGVKPFWAVILPPLGHAWGNTYGTLAMAWDTLIQEGGLSAPEDIRRTAFFACLMIWIWNFLALVFICWFYGRGKGVLHGLPAILLISLVQGGGELLVARFQTTLACFLPACLSVGAFLLLSRIPLYRQAWSLPDSPVMERKAEKDALSETSSPGIGISLFPYIFLALLAIAVLLVPQVHRPLSAWQIAIPVPGTVTGYGYATTANGAFSPVVPLTHAAFFLLCTCLVSLAVFMHRGLLKPEDFRFIGNTVQRKALPVMCSVILLLVLSKLMSDSGMAYVLSRGLSEALGRLYAPFSPLLGLLGALLTGSNTASNILFSRIQSLSAEAIGISPVLVLAAQTAGGTIGCSVSANNLMLGASMAGISGQEGLLLKKLLPPAIIGVLFCGILCLVLA